MLDTKKCITESYKLKVTNFFTNKQKLIADMRLTMCFRQKKCEKKKKNRGGAWLFHRKVVILHQQTR